MQENMMALMETSHHLVTGWRVPTVMVVGCFSF